MKDFAHKLVCYLKCLGWVIFLAVFTGLISSDVITSNGNHDNTNINELYPNFIGNVF